MKHEIKNGTFYHADCFDVMQTLPDQSIDMILCDLPYGTTACKWDSILPFDQLWKNYWRIAKPNAAVVLTASQPFTSALVMSAVKEFRHEWIWSKNRISNPFGSKISPMKKHESVLTFGKIPPQYYPQTRKGKPYRGFHSETSKIGEAYGKSKSIHKDNPEGILQPISIIEFPCEFGLHPTQKPVALFEYLIKTYTNEGMTVLDNCAGSGTTAIACENTNRKWICIEKDDVYAAKAIERIQNHEVKS